MKLQTSGVLGTSYAIVKLAPKRGKVNGQFPPKDANKRKDYTKKAYEVLQKVIKK